MRIVVKVGTSTLAHPGGRLNIRHTEDLVKVWSDIKNAGHELIVVSSAATGLGVGKLQIQKPRDITTKQAAAAVGQCELMYIYDRLFGQYNHTVAQMLLTWEDFDHENRLHNLRNTLERLLELGAIPIINENDPIACEEYSLGDNDTLAALVGECIHADLVVLLFVRVSAKPRDDDHDYGHGKYETLATLIIGAALAGVGIKLLWSGGTAIRDFTRGLLPTQPGVVALWAAVVSIVAKEALYRYTARVGRRVNSPSVVANAWHHRSDALSSVGTLVGIGCAYFLGGGWRLADPAAAIVVALLILRVAWQLMKMGMDELLEKSLPREQEEHILSLIAADPAVASPHNLRTRRIGQNIAVEVHIRVDGAMTVTESHRLTVDIERRLRDAYGEGTIVSIHVEPRKQPPLNESK